MKFEIKTLTPIHIGNGERYNGLAYLVKGKSILVYDSEQVLSNITSSNYNVFISWIEQQLFSIEQLKQKIKDEKNNDRKKELKYELNRIQKLFNLKNFVENVLNQDNIVQKFEKNFQFKLEILTRVDDNVEIDSFIKQNNKVYLPGSEIKGAIRTAILYKTLKDNINLWQELEKKLKEFQKKFNVTLSIIGSINKRADCQLLQDEINRIPENEKQLLFRRRVPDRVRISDIKKILVQEMGKIEEELQKQVFCPKNKKDAKFDLLKFLFVSDSNTKLPDDCIFVSELETLNMSNPRSSFREFLKEGQIFEVEVNVEKKDEILNRLEFSDYQKRILSIEKILECCYEFYNDLLEEEINYFNKNFNKSIVNKLEKIKEENKKESPVLRIGRDEGYLSLTIGLLVKKKNLDLYQNVLIHTTKNTSYSTMFPKTRKILKLNGQVTTIGWIKLDRA